jgi:teichoic acid transport system permease protein
MSAPAPATTPVPDGLKPIGGPQPLREYLTSVWRRREFAWNIAVGNLRSQHLDTVLGGLWHVVNPLLLIGVYYLVFGVIIERTSEGVPPGKFVPFLAVGIFIYTYVQRSISSGASSIVSNIGLIRSLQFPRALLPISSVTQQLLAFGSSILVMLVVLIAFGEYPVWGWLMLPIIVAVTTLFGIGGALITSRLTDQVRDLENVLPYLFRLTFYMSGILYSVDRWIDNDRLRVLFVLNPFYDIVGIARHYLMASWSEPLIGMMWLALLGYTAVFLVAGALFFRAGETRYGRG